MTTTHPDIRKQLRRREQEHRCQAHLTQIIGTNTPLREATARLIAACIHDGSGSALERFAASGELNTDRALQELTNLRVPSTQTRWVLALWQYLEDSDTQPPPEDIPRGADTIHSAPEDM